MKKHHLTHAIAAAVLMLAVAAPDANARAGGGVSIGRASPPPARSVPSYTPPRYNAPPPPPAPRYTPPAPKTEPRRSGSGSGFGSSFLGGMAGATVGTVLGNSMSRPDVVVAPGAVAAPVAAGGAQVVGAAPVVVERPVFSAFSVLLLLAAAGGGAYWWSQRRKQAVAQYRRSIDGPIEMDAITLFFRVQQAAMDDDEGALLRYCTEGMTALLVGHPEPGRDAKKTLTGLTWQRGDDSILYQFTDQVTGERVSERWMFDYAGRLDGIEVL